MILFAVSDTSLFVNDELAFAQSTQTTVTILPEFDRPPTIDSISDVIIDEGVTKTVTVTAFDPDGDVVSLAVFGVSFAAITNNTITISPGFSDAGDHTITVNATANNKTASTSFGITVNDSTKVIDPSNWIGTKTITINPDKISGDADLVDYPLLISFADVSLQSARNDGADLTFTDLQNNVLPFEIESWDGTTGTITSWVKIPVLSASQDTILLLHYNNTSQSVSLADSASVWDESYKAVYHMNQNIFGVANDTADSTSSQLHGTTMGAMNALNNNVPSKIGNGIDFDGNNDFIDLPDFAADTFENSHTISAWVNYDSLNHWSRIIDFSEDGLQNDNILLANQGTTRNLAYEVYDGNAGGNNLISPNSINKDNWMYVTITHDGNTNQAIMYRDGVEIQSGTVNDISPVTRTTNYIAKSNWSNDGYLDGTIDEVRISGTVKTPDWIATEHTNQNNPNSFYTISPAPIIPDIISPIITLTGDNPQTIQLGNSYTELGSTTDDGSEITINSSAFVDAIGSYLVYYNSIDASNNAATQVTRTVHVVDLTSSTDTKTITINPDKISGDADLVDYPLLISFADVSLQSARNDGADLTFTDLQNNVLPFEIESWDGTTGTINAWVNIPVLSASTNTILYLHYNNPSQSVSLADSAAVWDESYKAVYHMSQNAFGVANDTADSTSSQLHGTTMGAMNTLNNNVPSKIGNGIDFDGNDDFIDLPDFAADTFENSHTISAWVNYDSLNHWSRIIDFSEGGLQNDNILLANQGTTRNLAYEVYDGSRGGNKLINPNSIDTNTWMHVTITHDSDTNQAIMYKDGIEIARGITNDISPVTRTTNYIAKSNWSNDGYLDGTIDEVRISGTVKTPDWIATEHTNQNNPNSFYTISPTPVIPDITPPIITLTGDNPQTIELGITGYTELGATTDDGSEITINSSAFVDAIGSYRVYYNSIDASNNAATQVTRTVHVVDLTSSTGTKTITINPDKISGDADLVDYPLLVSFADVSLQSARNDGADLTFTDLQNNVLPFEIESWDGTTGTITSWVNVPVLSASEDTILLLHYNNPSQSVSLADPDSVWGDEYLAVYHMSNTDDSTTYNNDGVNSGTTSISGKISDSRSFDGINDRIILPNDKGLNLSGDTMTMSAWVSSEVTNGGHAIVGKSHHTTHTNPYYEWLLYQSNNNYHVRVDSTAFNAGNINANTWQYITTTYDGADLTLYVDGILEFSTPKTNLLQQSNQSPTIGGRNTPNDGNPDAESFDGQIDEVRISNVAKTLDWIKTEYTNQNDPNSFYTISPAPIIPDIISPIITQTSKTQTSISEFDLKVNPVDFRDTFNKTLILVDDSEHVQYGIISTILNQDGDDYTEIFDRLAIVNQLLAGLLYHDVQMLER